MGLVVLLLAVALNPAPTSTEEIPLPRAPYGATFDGSNFWTTDIKERRLIRLSPGGRSTSTFLGRGNIYGVDFNPSDGHLYVGAKGRLLRVNPVTVGKTDTIPVPVKRVAGVAFSGVLWYLLEKGTGKIHVYEPGLHRTIRTMETGRPALRDLAVRGGNLWATDGATGVVYRYRISDGALTGSLRAPSEQLRGLCFREGQLWIVDRNRRALVRLPYVESEYAIVSGEARYEVGVEIRYRQDPKRKGNLVILLPGGTSFQQATSVRAETTGWQRGYTKRGRPVLWKPAVPGAAEVVVRYAYRLTSQNARWYIPEAYSGPKENLDESLAFGYLNADEEQFNAGNPFTTLLSVLPGGSAAKSAALPRENTASPAVGGPDAGGGVTAFVEAARKKDLPARWTMIARVPDASGPPALKLVAEVYLRGPGWVPVEQPDPSNQRLFAQDAAELALYSAPDGEVEGTGPLFFVSEDIGRAERFVALPAQMTATIVLRAK